MVTILVAVVVVAEATTVDATGLLTTVTAVAVGCSAGFDSTVIEGFDSTLTTCPCGLDFSPGICTGCCCAGEGDGVGGGIGFLAMGIAGTGFTLAASVSYINKL